MPPEVVPAPVSGGIGGTVEWELISQLRMYGRRLVGREVHVHYRTSARSTRVHELWTALRELNIHIRTTFMTLQLELLLQSDSEEDEEPELDQSECGGDSKSEADDLSSQRSAESFYTAWEGQNDRKGRRKSERKCESDDSDEGSEIAGNNQALSHLQGLCFLLESRVNPLLVPLGDTTASPQTSAYPGLAHLVAYVRSPSAAIPDSYDSSLTFIPLPGSGTTPFLFNVAARDRVETAEAFVALCDPSSRWRPRRDIRKQMLADVVYLKEQILNFNIFVSTLQVSLGSLDTLASRPLGSVPSSVPSPVPSSVLSSVPSSALTSALTPAPTSARTTTSSFASFATLQKFRQQTSAALRAISSHFRLCESVKHKFLLQLPSWEDVSDRCPPTTDAAPAVRLFFTRCIHHDWQHASMYLLRSDNSIQCRPGKSRLCKALTSAHDDDRDLEFYVSGAHDSIDGGTGMLSIHIPVAPSRGRKYGDSSPGNNSLWTLIQYDYFAKEPTMDLMDHAGGDAAVLSIEQRRALAVKLVLGLMLSMDSDHSINTWDPTKIHFLEPLDAEYTPFILIDGDEPKATASRWDCLSLANLDALIDSGADDDGASDPKPLPPFALLAKALLHITGQQMRSFQLLRTSSGKAFHDDWKRFRRKLEMYTKQMACGREVDLETLPFLLAAQNCLEFHTLYTVRTISAQGKPRMEIAWQLIFDDILAKIDSSLDLGTCAAQTVGAEGAAQPALLGGSPGFQLPLSVPPIKPRLLRLEAQPEVALFDGLDVAENSREAQNADVFFEKLDAFRSSYSRFTTPHDASTNSGEEHPRRIRIAVLDTGIDFLHPGIRAAKDNGRIRKEWCHSWVGAEADVADEDDEMHGSNCASLLHQVAPEADIYIGKVFQRNRFRTYQAENIPKAIYHAVKTWKVDIISMSFGLRPPAPRTDGDQQAERAALEQYSVLVQDIETAIKVASPRVMFAAASNDGKNGRRTFPAKLNPWVIAVHASDGKGGDGGINPPTEASPNFMTLGMGVESIRKEREIIAGRLTQKYKTVRRCGTSFATPVAAGLAATVMDLSLRVDAITKRTSDQLKEPVEMAKMLRLMSTPEKDDFAGYYYVAPWNLWAPSWQADEVVVRNIWDKITLLFRAH